MLFIHCDGFIVFSLRFYGSLTALTHPPQSHSRAYAHSVSKLACMDAGKGREQDAVALTALLTGI